MPEVLTQALPAYVIALAYFKRCRTLRGRGRPVAFVRQLSLLAGVVLLLAAAVPPLATLDHELLAWHMVQHLIIGDLAALLIVLGLTGPVLQPLLALPLADRLRVLTHPLVALPLWIANLFAWHAPVLYQAALHSDGVHAIEHACFLGFGIAMWLALLGPLPSPAWFGNAARLVYVLVVRLTGAVLANVFIWSGTAFYPDYAPGEHQHGISALSDQGLAGSILMIEGSIVTIGLFAWLFLRAASEGERRQELIELAAAHGVVLDERRAGRAVAAGGAAELERRIRQQGIAPSPAQDAPAGGLSHL